MNFNLHFDEFHSVNSINDKNNLFENYNLKCYKIKRILISFNCFSEYIFRTHAQKEYRRVLEMKGTYILNILALLLFENLQRIY